MSLAQQLLLRALSRASGDEPVPRARWCAGAPSCTTASCCRTSSRQDFATCSTTCASAGFAVRRRLVRAAPRVPLPAHRRRSPRAASSSSCARRSSRGTCSARRRAAGGTARYVDSSVERLQVQGAAASIDGRHVVTCNGRARAAAPDRHARASSSPACATAPGSRRRRCTRRSPCTRRSSSTSSTPGRGRSLGGCTYHVAHPGRPQLRHASRSTPTRPRAGGWPASSRIGHTPGPRSTPRAPTPRSREFPFTLDLRRVRCDEHDRRQRARARAAATSMPETTAPLERLRRLRARRPRLRRDGVDAAAWLRPHWRRPGRRARARSGPAELSARARGGAADRSATTASPTTSTATRAASTGRGSSTSCRCSSRRTSGPASRPASRSARACSTLILADLYGPQRLLREGLLPPALVSANPGFLRPCHGVAPCRRPAPAPVRRRPRARARRRAGGCSPTARRRRRAPATRSRTGSSLSRSLPEAFRDCRVQRLAPFFRGLRETLHGAGAATDRRRPRVVLLTPGPVQRDLLRARLPRPLPRLHAGRGRRPDGARRAASS